jgi:preprotein translocase subunit SecB
VDAQQVAEGMYEVAVSATVTTKIKDKTVFLVEAKQAGIFEIRNLPRRPDGRHHGHRLPADRVPLPARQRGRHRDPRGGFPPVHLAEINFQAMYEQQQAQAGRPGRASSPSPSKPHHAASAR